MTTTGTAPISPSLRRRLRVYVDDVGIVTATREIGIGRNTMIRCLAAVDVRPSIAIAVAARLDQIDAAAKATTGTA